MGVAGGKIMRPTKSNKNCLPVAPTWRMCDSRKHCKKKQYPLPRNELIQSPWESRKKSWHYNHDKVFWIRDPVKVKTQAVSSPSGTWVTRHTTNNWRSFSRIAAETNWSCNYEMPGCHFIVFDSQNYGGGFSFPFCALRVLAAHFWLRCHQRASDLQRDTISAFVSHFQLPLSTFPAVVALNKQELSVVWFIFSQRGRKKLGVRFEVGRLKFRFLLRPPRLDFLFVLLMTALDIWAGYFCFHMLSLSVWSQLKTYHRGIMNVWSLDSTKMHTKQ